MILGRKVWWVATGIGLVVLALVAVGGRETNSGPSREAAAPPASTVPPNLTTAPPASAVARSPTTGGTGNAAGLAIGDQQLLSPSPAEQFPDIFGPDGCTTSRATPALSEIDGADLAHFRTAIGEDLYSRLVAGATDFSTAELQRIAKAGQDLQDVVTTCPGPEVGGGVAPSTGLRRGQSVLGYRGQYEGDILAGRPASAPNTVAGPGIRIVGPGSDFVLRIDTTDLGGLLDVMGLAVQDSGSGSTVPSLTVSYLDGGSGVQHEATAQSLVPALRPGEPAPIVVELGVPRDDVSDLAVGVVPVSGGRASRELQITWRPVKADRGSVTFEEIAVGVQNRGQLPIKNPVVVVAILDRSGAIAEIHVTPIPDGPFTPGFIDGV